MFHLPVHQLLNPLLGFGKEGHHLNACAALQSSAFSGNSPLIEISSDEDPCSQKDCPGHEYVNVSGGGQNIWSDDEPRVSRIQFKNTVEVFYIPSIEDHDGAISGTNEKETFRIQRGLKRPRVSFKETVDVYEVPSVCEYADEEREAYWTNFNEMDFIVSRNRKEFHFEGKDWRRVLEEDDFILCSDGQLYHPATVLAHLVKLQENHNDERPLQQYMFYSKKSADLMVKNQSTCEAGDDTCRRRHAFYKNIDWAALQHLERC